MKYQRRPKILEGQRERNDLQQMGTFVGIQNIVNIRLHKCTYYNRLKQKIITELRKGMVNCTQQGKLLSLIHI